MAELGSGHVRKIELDEGFSPTLDTIGRIRAVLRVDLPWLLTGRGSFEEGPLSSVLRSKPFIGQGVYFIGMPGNSRIKIGFTSNFEQRFETFQQATGYLLRKLLMLEGGKQLESLLHEMFANAHIANEWFEPSPELLEFVAAVRERANPECLDEL